MASRTSRTSSESGADTTSPNSMSFGCMGERPRHGDALLLATGQLRGWASTFQVRPPILALVIQRAGSATSTRRRGGRW